MKIRKGIAYTLIFSMLIALFPVLSPAHTAEAVVSSTSCEHGGSTEQLGYRGCSYCGGKGSDYDRGPRRGWDDLQLGTPYGAGTHGLQRREEIDENGLVWYCYYTCENCGDTGSYDCKRYTDLVYKKLKNANITKGGDAPQGPGKVPIRWCTHCGPKLAEKHQTYETVAKWAQYHLDPEPTPAPERTVTIEISPEGAGIPIGEGTYKVGSSVTVNASENIGWKFVGWTGSTSGLKNGNKSFNKGPVANTFKMPNRNVKLTALFEEDDDGVSPEVTKDPVKSPTPGPTPTSGASPTPKPVATTAPTPTPEPTATPAPSYPTVSRIIVNENVRHYTTDKGYTIQGIRDAGGPLPSHTGAEAYTIQYYAGPNRDYSIGIDTAGNKWYFIPSGSNATLVHPDIYKGRHAFSGWWGAKRPVDVCSAPTEDPTTSGGHMFCADVRSSETLNCGLSPHPLRKFDFCGWWGARHPVDVRSAPTVAKRRTWTVGTRQAFASEKEKSQV